MSRRLPRKDIPTRNIILTMVFIPDMWYISNMDRIQIIHSFKGERAVVMTMQIIEHMANPHVNTTNRTVIGALLKSGIFDREVALGIDEITELAAYSDRDYVGKALNALTVDQVVIQFRDEKRRKKFYLNRQFSSPVGQTMLPEKVFTKIEPVEVKTTTTKPKKEIQETFDLFNQELAKVFGEAKKLKALNDKRKKDIKKILELEMDNQKLFAGFFKHREDSDNEYLDFQYILRNPELYLNYKAKPTNGHVTPIFRNDPRMEAKLRLERQEREHQKLKEASEFNVLEELGGF